MKQLMKAVLVTSVLIAPAAHADFSGSYAIGLWNSVINGGTIDTSGAPGSVSLVSNNAGTLNANQDLTFTAFENATISFDWEFTTTDSGTATTASAQWDPFGYLLGGSFVQLTNNNGADLQSGSVSFDVFVGDVFGFRANTVDGIAGAATTVIGNFQALGPAPAVVPLPPAVWLLGAAISGLLMLTRRDKLPALPTSPV